MRIITLAVILCLCIIPLDIQLPVEPMPVGGHVVVEVVDAMTWARIPNATVAVYADAMYFMEYCVRTDGDLLVTEWAYYCDDELLLVAWHEDYYLNSHQYTVPYMPYDDKGYVMAFIKLFKKSTNTTADIIGEFPVDVPFGGEINLVLSCTLYEENTVFGMAHNWVNPNTDYEYSEGIAVVSSDRILETVCDYEWESITRFYYGFEIGRLYNDANAEDDGTLAIQIPVMMFQDCEIGVSVVDTVKFEKIYMSCELDGNTFIYLSEMTLDYRHDVSTFVYANETLDCVGEVLVEYGYQPSYVCPSGYIAIEDLRIIWDIPENTGSRPWPDFDFDLVDLYIGVVLVACAAIIIYVACWSRKNIVDPVVDCQ